MLFITKFLIFYEFLKKILKKIQLSNVKNGKYLFLIFKNLSDKCLTAVFFRRALVLNRPKKYFNFTKNKDDKNLYICKSKMDFDR